MKIEIGAFQGICLLICHRAPDRTFSMHDGELLPLCARCTGIYAGFAIGLFSQVLTVNIRYKPALRTVLLGVLLLAAIMLQAVGEKWGCWAWSNEGRLFIGLAVGGALSGVLVPLCRYFLSTKPIVSARHKPLDVVLFLALTGLALSVTWFPCLLSVLAIVSLCGLLAIYLCMNLAISGAALHLRDRNFSRGRALSLIALVILLFLCEGGLFKSLLMHTSLG